MKNVILCIDDEKITLMSLMDQLWEHYGERYIYETAMSAEEAMEIIDELVTEGARVILIISDWLMDGMKGDELIVHIHKKYPSVQTIMLTGQANPEAVRNAKANGGLRAFIAKPWEKSSLLKTIDGIILEA